ncbi:MAG TPA: DUF3108 domain-containing protein [Quisquiliibacterium sp.]|nr:DUF3108 domain-containing protein [Quisquiliibacterium sp.]
MRPGPGSPLRRRVLTALAACAAPLPVGARQEDLPARAAPGGQRSAPRIPEPAAEQGRGAPAGLPLPPTGTWHFHVHFGGYESGLKVAVLEYAIEHDGRRYLIRSSAHAEGIAALVYSGVLSQRSEGGLTPAGLVPTRYWEQRGKRPERSVNLDHRRREVVFSGNAPLPLVDGVQDRLSALVQLGLLARARPERFAAGQAVEFPELGTSRIVSARYASRGDAVLKTDSGNRRTLHLERVAPRDADDPRIEVWLGYDLHLLPLRMRVTDAKGRVLDQILDLR